MLDFLVISRLYQLGDSFVSFMYTQCDYINIYPVFLIAASVLILNSLELELGKLKDGGRRAFNLT